MASGGGGGMQTSERMDARSEGGATGRPIARIIRLGELRAVRGLTASGELSAECERASPGAGTEPIRIVVGPVNKIPNNSQLSGSLARSR